MTRPAVYGRRTSMVPDWRQLAALVSTSETLRRQRQRHRPRCCRSLSVTVMVSPLGMALGAVAVIT